MNFVLDTNVVSEVRKPRPDANVTRWLETQDPAHLFVTTITLAEMWQGFHKLPQTHPDYSTIRKFVTELRDHYRVLNFDAHAAAMWGQLTSQRPDPLPLRDSMIAAIVLARGYRVAPRDTAPFERAGCKVLNPWTG